MKKIFIMGLSCFLFAACGKKEEPATVPSYIGNVSSVKTPKTIYNECLQEFINKPDNYITISAEEIKKDCERRAEIRKVLIDSFNTYP